MSRRAKKNGGTITRFPRRIQFNIGLIISLFILAYVVFHIFSYFTQSSVTIYEVVQGSITTDNRYRAMAIRQESLVSSPSDGKVVYFTENGARVGVRSLVCALDTTGEIASLITDKTTKSSLTLSDLSDSEQTISDFVASYTNTGFEKTYAFKNALSETLSTAYGRRIYADNADKIAAAAAGGTFMNNYPSAPGLLILSTDGLEGITADNFTSDLFEMKDYKKTSFSSNSDVKAGDPIYKLVTDDNWQLVMPISNETKDALSEKSYVDVSFDADGKTATGAVSLTEKAGQTYLILTFDDSMERYADDRFLTVSLHLDQASGLKIPESAIVEKKFYGIPKSYFLKGDDSSDVGVLRMNSSGDGEFVKPTVYFEDEENYYTDGEKVSTGDTLRQPDGTNEFSVGSIETSRKGVYNVNKGYAVFKLIDIVYENGNYCIVKAGTSYGIALYDHIALQGDSVEENKLVY